MTSSSRWPALWATISFFATGLALHANVKLPAIFGDHMVLQQDTKLPVWGTADPGEDVTVKLGKESAHAKAGTDGTWRVNLPPLSANSAPVTLTVTGKNSLTFSDVLVGDVWVCSGQSNMEFSMNRADNAAIEIPKANDPVLRIFFVKEKTALDPLTDVTGQWQLCTPASIPTFSAPAYFFGRNLREHLKYPIGLIGTYWGGTPAQAWTSLSGLQKEPTLKGYVDLVDKIRASYPKTAAAYPAKMTAYKTALAKWQQGDGKIYAQALQEARDADKKAMAAHQPAPLVPLPRHPGGMPRPPTPPDGGQGTPTVLYNAMIAPLIPYALKGVIWYQGEANAGRAAEYGVLFPRMITDWREKWGQGEFPFIFVQLASYKANPLIQNWSFLREAQLKTLALPHTGMAVTIDIGNPNNIHPTDKIDVGNRLALAARHVAYGEKIVYSGPLYDSMTIKGNTVHLDFTHTSGGLIPGTAPWRPGGVQPLSDATLAGFTIAGKDQHFVPADATIKGDSVIVSSPQVSDPVAVRYAWANAPLCNLYNKENLPASPFRTDDWVAPAPLPPKK